MCIAYLAFGRHLDWPLFIAANRDEYHARTSRAASPWPQAPDVIAGIDLVAGGTWLGVTRQGRFGFLTNYRDPAAKIDNAPSRGQLAGNYLAGDDAPQEYANAIFKKEKNFNGFNLIIGDLEQAWYVSNHASTDSPQWLGAGSYTLSNHLLDTPWPKTTRLRRALDNFPLEALEKSTDAVFELLHDTTPASDSDLPATGVPLATERLLSSPFIVSPEYGTRCSTVIAIHASGWGFLAEITYDPQGVAVERNDWPFRLDATTLPGGPKARVGTDAHSFLFTQDTTMSNQLKPRLTDSVKSAMRAKDSARLGTLRFLLAAVKQKEVDQRRDLDDAEITAIIEKQVKQRRESIAAFEQAGRTETAAAEQAELLVLQEFLPQQATDEEVQAAIDAALASVAEQGVSGAPAMGKVMGQLKATLAGRADMAAVSARVKAALLNS